MAILKPTPPAKRRILHVGDRGPDVLAAGRALKKALKKHGVVPVNASNGLYGDGLLKDVLRWQKIAGVQASGRVGSLTWQSLDPFLDAYGKLLLTPAPKPVAGPGARVAHEMLVFLALAPRRYTQARPAATTVDRWEAVGGDCSGTAYLARYVSGVLAHWDGIGNTGTLWASGTVVAEVGIKPGDHVLYGSGGVTKHVAVYVGPGDDWVGHGSPGGPRKLPLRYRLDIMGFRRYW